jgi:transcription-repair coupling factor (superfamily II helicase)
VPAAGETVVDVEEDAFIPETYLTNNVERLNLYRRISEAGAEEELEALEEEMRDRFGPVPAEVHHLLLAARIKLRAEPLRLAKVIFKNERLFLDLPGQDQDPYFYEHFFHPLLEKLNLLGRRYVIREKKNSKLQAIIQEVPDLADGLAILGELQPSPSAQAQPS